MKNKCKSSLHRTTRIITHKKKRNYLNILIYTTVHIHSLRIILKKSIDLRYKYIHNKKYHHNNHLPQI